MDSVGDSANARSALPDVIVWLVLGLTGAALCYLCWAFAHTDRTLAMRVRMLWLFFATFAVFLVALAAVWRARPELAPRLVWPIVIIGIALRLSLAPVRPATTSDIYRYVWEGRVVRAGMNPYAESPESPRLRPLRDWVWRNMPFKRVPAAYPPVAQYIFAGAGLIPGNPVITQKVVLALFDIGTVLLLVSILGMMKLPRSWVVAYAWHPLAVCEVVARGHLDPIGIFFMVLALRLALTSGAAGAALSGAALAMGVLSKGYAIVAVPFFVLAMSPSTSLRASPKRLAFLGAMIVAAALAYSPFASAGWGLLHGGAMYASGWRGNSSVFPLLDLALSRVTPSHEAVARVICFTAVVIWLIVLVKRAAATAYSASSLPRFALLAMIGFFLLSPAVYPWYLAWTLPWLCLGTSPRDCKTCSVAGDRPLSKSGEGEGGEVSPMRSKSNSVSSPNIPWLILTGTIFGFYAHDLIGHHREIWWVTATEYAVPALVAASIVIRARPIRCRPSTTGDPPVSG